MAVNWKPEAAFFRAAVAGSSPERAGPKPDQAPREASEPRSARSSRLSSKATSPPKSARVFFRDRSPAWAEAAVIRVVTSLEITSPAERVQRRSPTLV